MRWLLAKDLLILRRSRLLVALLIVYPAVIALLIGFAISRAPSRPRVAIVDQTRAGATIEVGGRQVDVRQYARTSLARCRRSTSPRGRRPSRRSPRRRCWPPS